MELYKAVHKSQLPEENVPTGANFHSQHIQSSSPPSFSSASRRGGIQSSIKVLYCSAAFSNVPEEEEPCSFLPSSCRSFCSGTEAMICSKLAAHVLQ
ncbi:putative receptor-like protein kinase [Gossypium australe]|uniref:Putative receptor-like protein kinase n=1 Tax=Gossypium australe TaxID=47621 RepID=A0A5B6VD88_9ROSI|nr:putative receptor-like protein kinase [Gossypium australe]